MRSSCIPHPANEPLLIIRKWQIDATGDPCAAALLSYFEYWHNIKAAWNEKAKAANSIARKHGDDPTQDTSVYQFHTADEISAGIMGIYKKDKIRSAIKKLEDLKFISVHRNPNERYKFDATKHFVFHAETVAKWVRKYEDLKTCAENRQREEENGKWSKDFSKAIPETSNESSSEISHKGDTASLSVTVKSLIANAIPPSTTPEEPPTPQQRSATTTNPPISRPLPSDYRNYRPRPETEDEMYDTLEAEGVEIAPDYDGHFFEDMQRNNWTVRGGDPVYDWVALYVSRLEVTQP